MRNIYLRFNLFIALLCLIITTFFNNNVFITSEEAKGYPGFSYQGEYIGQIILGDNGSMENIGIQIASYGENEFRALLYKGGLPGELLHTVSSDEIFELEGIYKDNRLLLEGEFTLQFQYKQDRMIIRNDEDNTIGYIDKVFRKSPTLGMKPPENAIVLFDGTNLDNFTSDAKVDDNGLLEQGARTANNYGDKRLHIEAKLGFMPEYRDENRANSGIYIQNRYEVQILDSFAQQVKVHGNAALYNEVAPQVNVSYSPLTWQTYDIYFRAPRFDENDIKIENARITVYLNGILVHDQVELESGTGAGGSREEVAEGELYLQDHGGDPVRFRNIWIVEGESSPPSMDRLKFSIN